MIGRISDFLSVILPALFLVWVIHRAGFMTARTPHLDRISLILMGGGALGFLLDALLPLAQSLGIEVPSATIMQWAPWETWKETMFFAGVLGWCASPNVHRAAELSKVSR